MSLWSVAYIHVSPAKRAKWTLGVLGASFICKFYRLEARTDPCGAPACISLGVSDSPSTVTLKFPFVRNELVSFIKFSESVISIANQGAMWCQRLFRYPKIPQP
jgi:hypothetical protein